MASVLVSRNQRAGTPARTSFEVAHRTVSQHRRHKFWPGGNARWRPRISRTKRIILKRSSSKWRIEIGLMKVPQPRQGNVSSRNRKLLSRRLSWDLPSRRALTPGSGFL